MLAAALERRSRLPIQQSAMMQFGKLRCSHVLAHVQLGGQFIRPRWDKFFAVGMEVAEIGQDGKRLGLQFQLPDFIGDLEAMSLRITLTRK